MTDIINPLSVIRPGPIFCVMESDWLGSNQLKFCNFCFILFNPYRVVCSVCTAVSGQTQST